MKFQKMCKIERMGFVDKVIQLKSIGLGPNKIAKEINKLYPNAGINASNVTAFFSSSKKRVFNQALAEEMNYEIAQAQMKALGNWEKIDVELDALLAEAKEVQERIIETKKGDKVVRYKDLRLWNDVLKNIASITAVRAAATNDFKPVTHISITKIENQYNDLKGLLFKANKAFPGLSEWLEQQALEEDGS